MDDFLKDLDRLLGMADRVPPAPPLSAPRVLRRLNGLAPRGAVFPAAAAFEPPLRFMIGIGSAAAAAAVVVAVLALSTWRDLGDPFAVARFLPDVLSLMEI